MVTFYRRLPKIDYIRPSGIDEALDLLSNSDNGKYRVYAGGTDVIPKLKNRIMNPPEAIIDLKGIPDLDYIDYDERNGLRIGALATIRSVETSPIVRKKYPVLHQAANSIASIQVRNRGTIAGNICNAVPSADSAPALLALEAKLLCVRNKGERVLMIDEFFKGPNITALHPDELLKEIRIPPLTENCRGVYIKLSPRTKMDLAVVSVAILGSIKNGLFKNIRIGLGAVAPTPIRAKKTEELLEGAKPDDETIFNAAKKASFESKPIDDHRASAEYRKLMVEVLVKRAINQIVSKH